MSHSPERTTGEPESLYGFDKLGWLAFQEVVTLILEAAYGVPPSAWQGDADRDRWAVAAPDPRLEALGLRGPVLVLVTWSRFMTEGRQPVLSAQHRQYILEQLSPLARRTSEAGAPRSLLVVTESTSAAEFRRFVTSMLPGGGRDPHPPVSVLGSHELSEALNAHPELLLRYPSVLGVRAGGELHPVAGEDASRFDLEAALVLAGVFVPTRAYRATLDTLTRRGLAVLTGPPETGKTAIARMVGLAKLSVGWEVHECTRPEEVLATFRPEQRQVFIADDAFGSTEYRPDAADRWALDLERLLRCADENHWLIWTSRSAPLRAALRRLHRESAGQRFPESAQVQIDAAELDVEEKALILYRHAATANLDRRAVGTILTGGWELVTNPHFTPERIRRVMGEPIVRYGPVGRQILTAAVSDPTPAMKTSFEALPDAHRLILRAMLDVPPGPVAERDLAAVARRLSPSGLPLAPAELTDQLADHFLRVSSQGRISWVHPSWRDLVIDQLAGERGQRTVFLESCGIDGLQLALSGEGGRAGERRFPLIRDDADWDAVADSAARLAGELDDSALRSLLVALGDALERSQGTAAAPEVAAVAESVLVISRARLESSDPLPPLELLREWLLVASWVKRGPPDISRLWAELVPVLPVDPGAPVEIERLDRWMQLVELVDECSPDLQRWVGENLPRDFVYAIVTQFEDGPERASVPEQSREPFGPGAACHQPALAGNASGPPHQLRPLRAARGAGGVHDALAPTTPHCPTMRSTASTGCSETWTRPPRHSPAGLAACAAGGAGGA